MADLDGSFHGERLQYLESQGTLVRHVPGESCWLIGRMERRNVLRPIVGRGVDQTAALGAEALDDVIASSVCAKNELAQGSRGVRRPT